MQMIQTTRILVAAALAACLAACSTTANYDYNKAYDFNRIQRIKLVAPDKPATPDTRINSPLVMKRFDNGISNHLAARGYAIVDERPDVILRYQVGTRSGVESYGSGVSVGFSRFWRHTGVGLGYEFPDYDVESYDESVLTIDILDPANNSLLWRGSSSRRLYDGVTPEKLDETVINLVRETLANFPPGYSSKPGSSD